MHRLDGGGSTPAELPCGIPLEQSLVFLFSLRGPEALYAALDTLSFSILPHQSLPRCGHGFWQWMHCLARFCMAVWKISCNASIATPDRRWINLFPNFLSIVPPACNWFRTQLIVALQNPEHSLNSRVLSAPASSNVLMTQRRSGSLRPRPTAAIPNTSIFEEQTTTEGKWKKRKTRKRMCGVFSWLTAAAAVDSMVSFLHLILNARVIMMSRWATKLDYSKNEGIPKPCFSNAELACRLALQGGDSS